MKSKVQEKEKAIELRKKGHSYKEILKIITVAKSTLSNWLKDLPLTEGEKQYLKTRTDANISRGRIKAATSIRKRSMAIDHKIFLDSKTDFEKFINEPFFQLGLALYWAEGAKRTWGLQFVNSDENMINIMIKWLKRYLNITNNKFKFRLYTHKIFAHENNEKYWSTKLNFPLEQFCKTVYKPSGLGIKKRPNYKGCLRIEIHGGGASYYLKKVKAWQKYLIDYYEKQ